MPYPRSTYTALSLSPSVLTASEPCPTRAAPTPRYGDYVVFSSQVLRSNGTGRLTAAGYPEFCCIPIDGNLRTPGLVRHRPEIPIKEPNRANVEPLPEQPTEERSCLRPSNAALQLQSVRPACRVWPK